MTLSTGTWPGFVARVATPAAPAEIAEMIADAWPAVVGCEVTHGELLACLAQILLETGAGHVGYWNGNCGNVRGTYAGQWTSFTAGEGHGSNAVLLPPGPANRFRSYLGPEDDATDPEVLAHARVLGVRDYVGLLARKYASALERARAEDYAGFVHALHAGGYFTAAEETYEAAEARMRATVEALPIVVAYLTPAFATPRSPA